ncbi:MAG: adenylate cyclase, partial [Pseudobutyrivibrio sp.]|nr:adenylate cyclase [Pseudobutyrivibrio sp.]
AHWIWGGGWLAQLGFHDFAGSAAIHMVGGICALIGAKILGPRIGKFSHDKNGKISKVNAFPGHNIALGALGVFILWLGWYGFNGAAATSLPQLASIFVTTTIAPAVATCTTMTFTWIKFGKPDVSMSLNASLAGLVAITAPCDVTDALGAAIIGIVSGFLVVFGVWLLDYKLHVDDPVGAVAVHMMNGIWGTLAVGLFATTSAPASELTGLFYGGGFRLLGIQALGVVTVGAWAATTITIAFTVIKATIGLRASAEEEIVGLDRTEHGLPSAYSGFNMLDDDFDSDEYDEETASLISETLEAAGLATPDEAIEVEYAPSQITAAGKPRMTKVEILCKERNLEKLKNALLKLGITGMTVSHVMGCGVQKGAPEYYRGVALEPSLLPKIRVDVVVCKVPVKDVIETAKKVLYTGHIGDGKIFVYDVEQVVKIRTGEEDFAALQDVE